MHNSEPSTVTFIGAPRAPSSLTSIGAAAKPSDVTVISDGIQPRDSWGCILCTPGGGFTTTNILWDDEDGLTWDDGDNVDSND